MLGLAAIIALTGMNVFSLYNMRDQMVEDEQQKRISQLDEIHQTIGREIYTPMQGLGKLELKNIEIALDQSGQLPPQVIDVIKKTSDSNIFTDLYYTPYATHPCKANSEIYKYNSQLEQVFLTPEYPEMICDGVGLVRTKAKIRLNDIDYNRITKIEFDDNRTMNIGLINVEENRIIGYFTFIFNNEYILNNLVSPLLAEYYGESEETGVIAWVYNWASKEVIATNAPDIEYNRDLVDHNEPFNHFFSNWVIKLAFKQTPIADAYTATLIKNLFVLGVAVLFLVGALVFMFLTAQRERNLAQRQASFLANVTHELKTPLAVMQAAGENISDGRVTEPHRLKQYGQHIFNESVRLKGMIEKLLDVAKADSGQTIVKPAPHKLYGLVQSYYEKNKDYLEAKGFEVEFNSGDHTSVSMVDSDSIETILSNLTENAVKYSTDQKHLEFYVGSKNDTVYFSIKDHGVGIPAKHLKNIYNKFYRVEDSLSAKTKGHGLGLSIVQNMVELNGGEITTQSTVGKGTTFKVSFSKFVKGDTSLKADDNQPSDTNIIEHSDYV